MIQRIQSFWLLLASVCAFLTFKFPYYIGTDPKGIASSLNATSSVPLFIATLVVGLIAFFTIFLFKQRVLQLRFCALGILVEAVLMYLYYHEIQTYTAGAPTLWSILHSIILISFILAGRGINKDEKLIKGSSKLR
jgi:hypothetical protein